MYPNPSVKQQMHDLIDRLPTNASWDDVFYAVCVRAAAEQVLGGGTSLPIFTKVALRTRPGKHSNQAE